MDSGILTMILIFKIATVKDRPGNRKKEGPRVLNMTKNPSRKVNKKRLLGVKKDHR
jgi:hypothetical protein